jgi:broad specificity phosphatase PhoE
METRLYVVRHGNTFDSGDVVTRVGGRTDLPLSASGRAQAEALGRHFAGTVFASARSGPLKRTRETARAILAGRTDAPELTTDLFLREIDYGPDENRPEDEVVARIGKAALEAWERDSVVPDGWRVDTAALVGNWQETFAELRDQPGNHLIVTSNGIARFALHAAEATRADAKLSTAAWGVLVLDGETVRVEAWNVKAG